MEVEYKMFLLPMPKEIHIQEGRFSLKPGAKIVLDAGCNFNDLDAARILQEEIFKTLKFKVDVTKSYSSEDGCIYLKKSKGKAESYKLYISGKGIELIGADDAGLFYGVQTLRQIIRNNGADIQCLEINDEPYFPNRGFYHDATRGKVPTLETLKELADRASSVKINQIQLYIEHTFAFEGFSEVWTGADPLTAEEILLFDEYCRKKHIELVPSLSTFGHLYMALSTRSFSHLCELENSQDMPYSWVGRMEHHTLDVSNPGSLEFVENMLNQFIPLFSSNKFNICCDETFDLGEGKNKELAKKLGKGKLYVDFLKKIIDIVKKHGKEVMFWGDIILSHPEYFDQIPKDTICLNWDYSANPSEEKVKAFAESGISQYVCPGVGGWNQLMNALDSSFSNIRKMVDYGVKYNASGVLNTDWGDYGHINLFGNSIPGMIYGGALSWNPEYREEVSAVDEAISRLEYGDTTGRITGLLRELSRQYVVGHSLITYWRENKFIGYPNLSADQKERLLNLPEKEVIEAHDKALKIAEEIAGIAPHINAERSLDMREFYVSARGIALYNALGLVIKKYDFNNGAGQLIYPPKQLAGLLECWLADYMQVWRARNKESELYRIRESIVQICKYLRDIK